VVSAVTGKVSPCLEDIFSLRVAIQNATCPI